MSAPAPEPGDRILLALAIAAAAGVIAALGIVDYLPMHDGPQHVFLGYLSNHFTDPGASWPAWLERGHPYTALGFSTVFAACERVLPWRVALRLTLAISAVLWGASYFAFARALHPRRAAIGLIGFATALTWGLYMGLISFNLSIGLGFAVLAVAVGSETWSLNRRLGIAVLLFVQAIAHVFGAELTGLVLLAIVAARASSRDRLREIGMLALMGAPAVAIALTAQNPDHQHDSEWIPLAQRFLVLPRTFLPGPLWRAFVPVALAIAGLYAAYQRAARKRAAPAEIAVALSAALFLILAFTVPLHLAAWEFFAPRFLPFGILLAAALLPIEELPDPRRRAAVLAISIFTLASLGWAARTHVALRARVADALAGLSAPIHRSGPRMIVPMDPFAGLAPGDDGAGEDIPFYAPLFNLGALYAVQQGGIPSYTFVTNPKIHPFVFSAQGKARYPELYDPADLRDPRLASDPLARRTLLTFLATVGMPFEDVVIDGRPEDGQVLADRGYVTDFQKGGLFIGHFEGCPVTVEIHAPAQRAVPLYLEYGFDPMPRALDQQMIPPPKTPPAEPGEVTLKVVPKVPLCGGVWARVTLDLDKSRGPSKGDHFCEGADGKGRLHLTPRWGQTIPCRIAP